MNNVSRRLFVIGPTYDMVRSGRLLQFLLAFLVFLVVSTSANAYVLVFKSKDLLAYSAPIKKLKSTLKTKGITDVRVRNMEGDLSRGRSILKEYKDSPPEVIYALGAQAAYVSTSKKHGPTILGEKVPVVFSSVLNWKKYNLNKPYSTGVKGKVSVNAILLQTRMAVSDVKKIGIIYSAKSSSRVKSARKVAKGMGLEIVAEKVDSTDQVKSAFSSLKQKGFDALWMIADPVVITTETFNYLSSQARSMGKPTIVYSENFVKAGGFVSVSVSYETIGSQVASIISEIINGKPVSEIPIADPIGTQFIGNVEVAKKLGVDLKSVRQFMDKTVKSSK